MVLEVVLVSLVLSHASVEPGPLPVLRSLQAGLGDVRENPLAGRETVRHGYSLHTEQSRALTGHNLHMEIIMRD